MKTKIANRGKARWQELFVIRADMRAWTSICHCQMQAVSVRGAVQGKSKSGRPSELTRASRVNPDSEKTFCSLCESCRSLMASWESAHDLSKDRANVDSYFY
jgi:hypothetical protein